jgi:hypothetical protein
MLLSVIFQQASVPILEALAHLVSCDAMLGRKLFQYTFRYRYMHGSLPRPMSAECIYKRYTLPYPKRGYGDWVSSYAVVLFRLKSSAY